MWQAFRDEIRKVTPLELYGWVWVIVLFVLVHDVARETGCDWGSIWWLL